MSDRPDPITPKTTGWTTVGLALGAVAGVIVDIQWDIAAGNNAMDWVRVAVLVVSAIVGTVYGAQQAKKETTPLADPMDDQGQRLYPAGVPPQGAGLTTEY